MSVEAGLSYDPSAYPYDTVVRISDVIGGRSYQASGVLISPDEVLTASHVVYIQGVGTATNITVSQGFRGGLTSTGTNFHYFSIADANDIISNSQSQTDYAVIHLATPFTGAGTMGIQADYGGGAVSVTGYPVSSGTTQVNSVQTVVRDPVYTLLDGSSLGPGSSGGPVWIEQNGKPFVVGLVSSGSLNNTIGYNVLITTAVFNQIQTWVLQDDGTALPTPTPQPTVTLIHSLDFSQQLELTYIGYFNRSADTSGLRFWSSQNQTAQAAGQSADDALKNIANSFSPQTETYALYPFLTSTAPLTTPASQASLSSLVGNVYANLFGRAADASGKSYWVGQLTSGAVSLGASILTIANGATGSDATALQNKITVALDFTTRTGSAGLGISSVPASFVTAAKSVLGAVDGNSLGDASVTTSQLATTAYLAAATKTGVAAIGTSALLPTGDGGIARDGDGVTAGDLGSASASLLDAVNPNGNGAVASVFGSSGAGVGDGRMSESGLSWMGGMLETASAGPQPIMGPEVLTPLPYSPGPLL